MGFTGVGVSTADGYGNIADWVRAMRTHKDSEALLRFYVNGFLVDALTADIEIADTAVPLTLGYEGTSSGGGRWEGSFGAGKLGSVSIYSDVVPAPPALLLGLVGVGSASARKPVHLLKR